MSYLPSLVLVSRLKCPFSQKWSELGPGGQSLHGKDAQFGWGPRVDLGLPELQGWGRSQGRVHQELFEVHGGMLNNSMSFF